MHTYTQMHEHTLALCNTYTYKAKTGYRTLHMAGNRLNHKA